MGWVQKNRNKGGIVFVDLRDRSGLLQIIFENGSIDEAGFEKAGKLRSEFVIAVVGTVEARSGAVNENLATGEIEIRAREIRILSLIHIYRIAKQAHEGQKRKSGEPYIIHPLWVGIILAELEKMCIRDRLEPVSTGVRKQYQNGSSCKK